MQRSQLTQLVYGVDIMILFKNLSSTRNNLAAILYTGRSVSQPRDEDIASLSQFR